MKTGGVVYETGLIMGSGDSTMRPGLFPASCCKMEDIMSYEAFSG
jgi:hypothetical protein